MGIYPKFEVSGFVVFTISMDLPFAQARWCGANEVDNVTTASDFKDRQFGDSYGVHVKENGLLARAVFVVDKNDTVTHVEYVPVNTQLPDFDAAVEAATKAAG